MTIVYSTRDSGDTNLLIQPTRVNRIRRESLLRASLIAFRPSCPLLKSYLGHDDFRLQDIRKPYSAVQNDASTPSS